MIRKKRNYSRFYAIAKAKGIDLDQHKETLVSQFTGGRTASLREMTPAEYEELCECLQTGKRPEETPAEYTERLRRARSAALIRMQRLGVDTADGTFAAVDEFCLSPRIAGKPFGLLSAEELQALVPKLEAMLRKPKPEAMLRRPKPAKPKRIAEIPIFIRPNQLPS